jgi:hypothetical protein
MTFLFFRQYETTIQDWQELQDFCKSDFALFSSVKPMLNYTIPLNTQFCEVTVLYRGGVIFKKYIPTKSKDLQTVRHDTSTFLKGTQNATLEFKSR